ncbi:MAG: phosphatase PAP2 family protein [Planctomycetota bacterium]|nr:phosphatase PAP2 family protein [Planctomycetota bacterium]
MNESPTVHPALDPLQPRGMRHWITIWILLSLTIAFGIYLPVYSIDDNPAFRGWKVHIDKQRDQAPSPSWPAEGQRKISFDSQMVLEARRGWDEPEQPDSAGSAIRTARKVAAFSTHLAKGEAVLIALLVIWLFTWRRRLHEQLQRQLLGGFLGLVAASVVATALKFLIGRGRPNELLWRGRLHWDSLALDHNHHSFPSGHATASGALVMVLILVYPRGWPIWLAAGIWLCATRVLVTEHWPTDTLMGFILGAFCVAFTASLLARRQAHQVPASNQSCTETVSPVE